MTLARKLNQQEPSERARVVSSTLADLPPIRQTRIVILVLAMNVLGIVLGIGIFWLIVALAAWLRLQLGS
jgi:hypothetical protein